jgi:RimJ/RimL family protein N-acetyltransferase
MISTPRLLLRPFSLADVPKVFAMGAEEGIRRWIPDQVYRDQPHAELVVRALIGHTNNRPDPAAQPYVLGIEQSATGDLIGHIGLSPARGTVEIGYAVEQRLQGQGLATEAVTAMARWASAELSLPEILGIVAADNVQSRRVLEKAGFVWHRDEVGRAATLVIYRYAPALTGGAKPDIGTYSG